MNNKTFLFLFLSRRTIFSLARILRSLKSKGLELNILMCPKTLKEKELGWNPIQILHDIRRHRLSPCSTKRDTRKFSLTSVCRANYLKPQLKPTRTCLLGSSAAVIVAFVLVRVHPRAFSLSATLATSVLLLRLLSNRLSLVYKKLPLRGAFISYLSSLYFSFMCCFVSSKHSFICFLSL